MPDDWNGTTFDNSARQFVGVREFKRRRLRELIINPESEITPETLQACGVPGDYLRVDTPVAALFEVYNALRYGYDDSVNVISFASKTLPIISVLLSSKGQHVHIYGTNPFTPEQEIMLREDQFEFTFHEGNVSAEHSKTDIVLFVSEESGVNETTFHKTHVDATIVMDMANSCGLLCIENPEKIPPIEVEDSKEDQPVEYPAKKQRTEKLEQRAQPTPIYTLRKRYGIPIPTPEALAAIQETQNIKSPDVEALNAHLMELAGKNAEGNPLITVSGLSALSAVIQGARDPGKTTNVLRASNCYGGSGQLCKLIEERCSDLYQTLYSIQDQDLIPALGHTLSQLEKTGKMADTTVIVIEEPTNPGLKTIADFAELKKLAQIYSREGKKILFVFDTSLAPCRTNPILDQFGDDFPAIVWTSLSKSFSGGLGPGGAVVGNEKAQEFLSKAKQYMALFDTGAKSSQLKVFVDQHEGVEKRVKDAYDNAQSGVELLKTIIKEVSGHDMPVNFVPDQSISSSTFSFNLPVPERLKGESEDKVVDRQAFAQTFVTTLCDELPGVVKPCVSFGQSVPLVYITVPATSTQGTLSRADVKGQEKDGIQLVRCSFPPQMDMARFEQGVRRTIQALYS